MQYAKTFRLFISSTFSDFRREREILQTKVFPVIREYAMSLGYTFQPIDLRWGVSDEAQLDQKTLELCLDEVRSCKSYDYPNFLFMLGDRYGWVPLPYSIEVKEFEKILAIVIKEEKKLLLEWYYLDSNQLPSSYILLERKGEYKDFNHWVNVESKIRDIFQRTAKEVGLTKKEEEKYFLSATEAEIVEGIIPYISPTKYQKEILLKEAPFLEKIDSKYVFGFFRNICNKENPSSEFIDKNREKIVSIKESIKKLLPVSNIFEVDTTQLNEHRLEEDYLEIKIEKQSNETLIEYLKKVKENYGTTFEYQVISFIKSQIDNQKNIQKTDRPLEVEKQYIFAKQKRKNFLETESLHKILDSLDTYISKSNIDEPFIIYGKSGSGKSALLAKAIEKTQLKMHKKVIYRFVGATPESSSSKNLLVSILSELGIDILQTEERNNNEYLSFETFRKEETFEEFSYRVNQIISHNIEDEVVIFIDAVDQLIQSDKFLWLPKKLPKNIKIIISVLSDEKYINENQFFETLKNKTDNLYRIPAFDEPEKLLDLLLKEEDRSIDEFQKQYFLGQFFKVETPLYVLMASQEMKHWKSGDRSQTLASTQHGIVKEFIENLSKLHHHNAEFVQTVFAYIYASKNGLSESELLQLLSSDSNFIQKMAPETWYENPTKELPFVHWSRLHTQLKPFLSIKEQDGEELIYFFHREFESVLKEVLNKTFLDSIYKQMSFFYKRLFDEDFLLEYCDKIDGKQSLASIRVYKKLLYFLKKDNNYELLQYYIVEYLFIYSLIYDYISMDEKVSYLQNFDMDTIKDYLISKLFELNKQHIDALLGLRPFEPDIYLSTGLYQPMYRVGEVFENLNILNYAIEIYQFMIDKEQEYGGDNYIFIAKFLYALIDIYDELADVEKLKKYCYQMLTLKYPRNREYKYNKPFINIYEKFYKKYAIRILDTIVWMENHNSNNEILYDDFLNLMKISGVKDFFTQKEIDIYYQANKNHEYDQIINLFHSRGNLLEEKYYNELIYKVNLRISFLYIKNENYLKALQYLYESEKYYIKIDFNFNNYKSIKLLSSMALCLLKERELKLGEEYLNKAYEIGVNIHDIESLYQNIFDLATNEYVLTVGVLTTLYEQIIHTMNEPKRMEVLIDVTLTEIEESNLYLHPISVQVLAYKVAFLKKSNVVEALEYIEKTKFYAQKIYKQDDEEYLKLQNNLNKVIDDIRGAGYIL
jgi:hypothetical protein